MIVHNVTDYFDNNSKHSVVELNGLFIYNSRDSFLADLLESLAGNGAKLVKDWAGGGKRVTACRELLKHYGFAFESIYDAARGRRRYKLAAYPSADNNKRRIVLTACHGMRNTNPESKA